MGGKTQQRVAGNAKPTNSGRIRGLLSTQQLSPSNIITFSSLTTKNRNQTLTGQSLNDSTTMSNSLSPVQHNTTDNTHSKSADIQRPIVGSSRETRLVVRRVGNRDLYTRVKLTDPLSDLNGSVIEDAVKQSDAGVKKPNVSLSNSEVSKDNIEKSADLDDPSAEEEIPKNPNDDLDFDQLVDQLTSNRASVEQNRNASSLIDLNEISVEHELNLLSTFRILLKKFVGELSIEEWDLIVCSLDIWIGWISKSEHPMKEAYHNVFCTEIFKFIHQLFLLADSLRRETMDTEKYPMLFSLLDDWGNFSSSSMFSELIALYLELIASNQGSEPTDPILLSMMEALAHIILTVDPKKILSHHDLLDYLNTNIEFDPEFKAPINSIFCSFDEKKFKNFIALCGLMRSNSRLIIVTAHATLNTALETICDGSLSSTLISDQEAVDDLLIFPPRALMAILTSRDSMMSALLSDYRVGDISVTIEPCTDSYGCTLSYLFAWDLTIQFIVGMDKEVGQCVIHSLKKLGLLQRLLDNIFILLPPLDDRDSLDFRFESSDPNSNKDNQNWSIGEFLKAPLKTTIKRPVNEIELVALHLYFSVALHMPVTVRKWYNNNSNKRLCNLVNQYTVKHVSQLICSLEMESVMEKCNERVNKEAPTNLTIKARPSAKEVYAIYTRDEFKMELTIKLPLNYPLGPVQIDGGKRVGVTDVKWRSWLLQLTTFLAHQNGPILDGIDLWRKNIDKRFEGIEKCTICFSILHSNYQLPKKKCQTCANMFHNLCLYKWFQSSGNSTCPLCRNPW